MQSLGYSSKNMVPFTVAESDSQVKDRGSNNKVELQAGSGRSGGQASYYAARVTSSSVIRAEYFNYLCI